MEFYQAIESSLSSLDYALFNSLFYSTTNESSRDEMSWDLALLFMDRLEKQGNISELKSCIEKANLELTLKSGNPKELFLVYLQNSAYFASNESNFIHFLDLTQNLFERINSSKFTLNSLDQVIGVYKRFQISSNLKI